MAKETLSQREIKFRAWHKKLKKMFYLFGIDWQEGICWDKEAKMKLKDVILLQYTGLKDKNKKEIYGGDIVEFKTDGILFRLPVVWGEYDDGEYIGGLECWMVDGTPLSSLIKDKIEIYAPSLFADDGVKVVGNIFENSNLLH